MHGIRIGMVDILIAFYMQCLERKVLGFNSQFIDEHF